MSVSGLGVCCLSRGEVLEVEIERRRRQRRWECRSRCEKRHFLRCHLWIKTNILPRQARDKCRESTQKRVAAFFPQDLMGMVTTLRKLGMEEMEAAAAAGAVRQQKETFLVPAARFWDMHHINICMKENVCQDRLGTNVGKVQLSFLPQGGGPSSSSSSLTSTASREAPHPQQLCSICLGKPAKLSLSLTHTHTHARARALRLHCTVLYC